ncbi:MAG: hypothetical protein E6R04_01195 [Spirochaetes bacterium]|nr:MAG: hypothetical protein E6R04_01195 [Spirochaetota bacterium]
MALKAEFCFIYRVVDRLGPKDEVVFTSAYRDEANKVASERWLSVEKVLAVYVDGEYYQLGEKITMGRQ